MLDRKLTPVEPSLAASGRLESVFAPRPSGDKPDSESSPRREGSSEPAVPRRAFEVELSEPDSPFQDGTARPYRLLHLAAAEPDRSLAWGGYVQPVSNVEAIKVAIIYEPTPAGDQALRWAAQWTHRFQGQLIVMDIRSGIKAHEKALLQQEWMESLKPIMEPNAPAVYLMDHPAKGILVSDYNRLVEILSVSDVSLIVVPEGGLLMDPELMPCPIFISSDQKPDLNHFLVPMIGEVLPELPLQQGFLMGHDLTAAVSLLQVTGSLVLPQLANQQLEDEIRSLFAAEFPFQLTTLQGEFLDVLKSYALDHPADVIILDQSLFGPMNLSSFNERLRRHLKHPILLTRFVKKSI